MYSSEHTTTFWISLNLSLLSSAFSHNKGGRGAKLNRYFIPVTDTTSQ